MSNSNLTLIPSGDREVVDQVRATEIVKEWQEIIDGIGEGGVVEKIVLNNKSYTAEAARIIQDFVAKNNLTRTIKDADLSDIIASRMEEEGLEVLKVICDAFGDANLEEVDLSDNAMGSKGITACASVLSGQSNTLKRLSLCNNGLSGASMTEVADVLCEVENDINIASRLTKIHFYNNMSGDEGCTAFSRIIGSCSASLEDVRFSGTRAGRPGSYRVAQAMDNMGNFIQNVKRWDLADNTFGEEGGEIIAKAFARCPNLEYLNLRDCSLGDEGIAFVCDALATSKCPLKVLDLSGNEITASGAKKVGKLLPLLSKTLVILHIEENEMTSRGVSAIAKGLGVCSLIEEIKLGMNECGNIGGQALCDVADKLSALSKIELDNNMFSEKMVENLTSAFDEALIEMEDNDDEEDPDEDFEDDDDDEDIADLTATMAETSI